MRSRRRSPMRALWRSCAIRARCWRRKNASRIQRKPPNDSQEDLRKVKLMQRVYDPFWDTIAWRLAVRAVQKAKVAYPGQVFTLPVRAIDRGAGRRLFDLCVIFSICRSRRKCWTWKRCARRPGSALIMARFSTDPLERWKDKLPPAEIALCQRLTAPQMKSLGYAPVAVPLRPTGAHPAAAAPKRAGVFLAAV